MVLSVSDHYCLLNSSLARGMPGSLAGISGGAVGKAGGTRWI